MMLVRALECNMTMIAVEPSSNPLQNIKTGLSNGFAAFVPLQLQEMMSEQGSLQKLNLLKCMIVGGGAVHASLQKELNKLSCTVYATYGMTETVSHIALQQLNGKESSDHFTVLPGIKISKDNRDCLVIQVPEFSEKIITNDLIDLISSNQFRWLGRFDNVINSGGFKISPEKIEKTLEDVFHNQSFFVTGIADERLGEKLVLFVEGNSKIDLPEVKLHPYEIPKEIYYLPEFIRTETGKINREKTKSLVTPNQ
jgi:o-succinylbenzoate---CoA ligase